MAGTLNSGFRLGGRNDRMDNMKIEKKTWPEYFEKVLAGEKNFDLRLADWECKAGDILLLREWNPETKKYTGRQIEKEVSCVIKSKNLNMFSKNDVEKFGYQAIGFK
jgi:ribosomal protein S17